MRIQPKKFVASVIVGAGALFVAAASAQAPEPIIGTWTMDVAKSSFKPGPAPKGATVVIESAGGKALKVSVDGINADGAPLKWGFTTQRDGKDAPVTGNPAFDTAASTQTNSTSGTTDYKKGGKVVLTSKYVISKDGKTLTLTATGTDPKGQAVHNVTVYTKQ